MVSPNAQSQASPKGRSKENSQHELVGYESTEARPVSRQPGNKSLRSCRNDSQGRDVFRGAGGSFAGGTIKQFIGETLEELKDSEARSDKLRKRLVQLTNLLETVESSDDSQKE
ncbi:hypothetical protein [Nostoc sp. PA-18-2419]|uniref:hypothetical protein n=1 Tax=Nostoc sp. PA-18-2419 TaxID=2575443 RepID=UPI001CB8DC7A|nr:hypothetical protein [Nostoc sp. PA-18-2419]